MRTQIRKIGNSLGNIIPAPFIRQLGLKEGSEIEVTTEGEKIIIASAKPNKNRFPFSEQELLNSLDAHNAHSDEIAIISTKELGEP